MVNVGADLEDAGVANVAPLAGVNDDEGVAGPDDVQAEAESVRVRVGPEVVVVGQPPAAVALHGDALAVAGADAHQTQRPALEQRPRAVRRPDLVAEARHDAPVHVRSCTRPAKINAPSLLQTSVPSDLSSRSIFFLNERMVVWEDNTRNTSQGGFIFKLPLKILGLCLPFPGYSFNAVFYELNSIRFSLQM